MFKFIMLVQFMFENWSEQVRMIVIIIFIQLLQL